MTLHRVTDGGDDACLIDVPAWDFTWQQFYMFPDDSYVPVRSGDIFRVSCEWDNSAANQPVVDGEQLEPRDVEWGETTLDEMCFGVAYIRTPYAGGEPPCGGFGACWDACDPADATCFTHCSLAQGEGCFSCLFGNIEACAIEHCAEAALPFSRCLDRCEDGYGCFSNDCATEFGALAACLKPQLDAGECPEVTDVCNVVFPE